MAKTINGDQYTIILYFKNGSNPSLADIKCRTTYTVKAEDLAVTRSIDPVLTQGQKTTLAVLGREILVQIKEAENIS